MSGGTSGTVICSHEWVVTARFDVHQSCVVVARCCKCGVRLTCEWDYFYARDQAIPGNQRATGVL